VWPSRPYGRRAFLGSTAGAVIGLQPVTCLLAYGAERRTSRSLNPMNEIQGIGRLKIHDGKLEDFKRVALQFMQVVRTKDTGTLKFELYLSADQTECIVLESYRDVRSLLEHHNNISGLMDALLKTCSPGTSEVCATANPELIKALDGTPVRLFSPYQPL
jgi:quinol monooxygenase YgiN